jgi:hypothetical protein
MIGVAIACLILLLGLLIPIYNNLFRQKAVYSCLLLLSIISFSIGSATSDFDALHPRQNTLFYALDSNKQQAYWLSTDKQLDHWTKTFFNNQKEKHRVPEIFSGAPLNLWSADAPALPLSPPEIEKLADNVIDSKRILKLKVKSIRHAPKLSIEIEGVEILNSKVAGKAYSQSPQANWRLDSFGLNDEDFVIDITVKPGIPFTVRITDFSYGLPELKLTQRPSDTIPKPGEYSDTTAVVKIIGF